MSGRTGMVYASALLLAALGCTSRAFLAQPAASAGYREVVAGTPGEVAAVLESGLSDAGVPVLVKHKSGEVRLAGRTKSGQVFCLYVKSEKTTTAQRTAVTIHWDRAPDEPFWRTVGELLSEYASEEEEDHPPEGP